jgi:hypothetical protein
MSLRKSSFNRRLVLGVLFAVAVLAHAASGANQPQVNLGLTSLRDGVPLVPSGFIYQIYIQSSA